MTKDYHVGFEEGYKRCSSNSKAEVINGNLWVGYEDGVRVGFHYWNGTWYRNGVELLKIGEKRK